MHDERNVPLSWRLLLPIAAVTLLLAFFRLGAVPLFDVDEAVFSEATREMVETGNWITPTYNGVNRYDKPILFYWLMAASYRTAGINELAARLPSACAGVLLVAALYLFAARFAEGQTAVLAAAAVSISLYFAAYARAAVTDMTLSLFIMLSLFCLYRAVDPAHAEADSRPAVAGFYLFSALAFLTKGLIGILFPFGIGIVFLMLTDGIRGTTRLFSFWGIIVFLAVSGPWYGAQLAINGREFIDQFIVKHHLTRFTGVISGHRGPVYYYLPALLAGLFPWVAYLPAGLAAAWKDRGRLEVFSAVWFVIVVCFFSLSTTKLPNYILPAVPAAALLIAAGIRHEARGWRLFSELFLVLLCLLLGIGLFVGRRYASQAGIADTGWLLAASALPIAMAVVTLAGALRRRPVIHVTSGLMIAFILLLLINGLPAAGSLMQGTLRDYSLYARSRLAGGGSLVAYGINKPSIAFYAQRFVITPEDEKAVNSIAEKGGTIVAITKTDQAEVFSRRGFTLLRSDNRYALLER